MTMHFIIYEYDRKYKIRFSLLIGLPRRFIEFVAIQVVIYEGGHSLYSFDALLFLPHLSLQHQFKFNTTCSS
jgi:hypothetical protein